MSSGIPLGITSEDSYIVLQGSQGEGNGHYTNGAVIHHRQVTMTHPRAPFHRPAQKPEEGVTSFSNRPYKSEALLQHVQSNIARPLAYRPRERPSDVTWRAVIVAVVGAAKKSTDSLVSERRLDSLKVPIVVQIKPIFSILVSLN
ncbi:uncharacterized protein BHQ10_004754 [Talaromyces amestolkiae]|uniref:Uncharacterized protein n=1 Tax=Talaromyces amestolkiae TaxID=1196081 RepID=A0A364KYW4_TALAM|nr:uncharacterized protein BHQ10_004754 [Talaromyces amestolkiae]RAO68742.1 hypothetical protein BHQ10_004754 [Talaromyces amestolkiae]